MVWMGLINIKNKYKYKYKFGNYESKEAGSCYIYQKNKLIFMATVYATNKMSTKDLTEE